MILWLRRAEAAHAVSHYAPDILHTFVSFRHQGQRCQCNILLPKNDCPSKASFSVTESGSVPEWLYGLSLSPCNQTAKPWGVPSREGEHDLSEHSAQ